jgi:flagellar protein FlaG
VVVLDIARIAPGNSMGPDDYSREIDSKAARAEKAVNDTPKAVDKKPVDDKALKSSVDVANKVLFKNNSHLKFEIHEKTKDIMVKIIDDNTGEVLKEIPPEKMLDMVAKMWEVMGIIVDEKR